MVKCPDCGSENVYIDKKGYGLGKAAVGMVVAGPVGLLGGFLGSKKLKAQCLDCKWKWKI
jgi:hypothetical protein